MKKRTLPFLLAFIMTLLTLSSVAAAGARAAGELPFDSLTFDCASGGRAGMFTLHGDGTFEGGGYDGDPDGSGRYAYKGAFRDIQRMGADAWKMTCERTESTVSPGRAGETGGDSREEAGGPRPDEVWYLYAPGGLPLYTRWAENVRLAYGDERLKGSFILVPSKDQEALPYAASVKDSERVLSGYGLIAVAMDGGNIYFDPATGTVTDADGYIIAADIPDNVNGVPVRAVGERAFEGCVLLESVTLPEGLETVGEGAFYGCEGLGYLSVPASVESAGAGAFGRCAGLDCVNFGGSAAQWRTLIEKCGDIGLDSHVSVSCAQPCFSDVPDGHWARRYVDHAVINGIMRGVGGGLFLPDGPVDMGTAVTVLARLKNADTGDGPWYAPGMRWAEAGGLTGGKGHAQPVERQELVRMLWLLAGSPASDGTALEKFPDWAQVDRECVTAMSWAVEKGLINGNGAGLAPKGAATRAMYAAVIERFLY